MLFEPTISIPEADQARFERLKIEGATELAKNGKRCDLRHTILRSGMILATLAGFDRADRQKVSPLGKVCVSHG